MIHGEGNLPFHFFIVMKKRVGCKQIVDYMKKNGFYGKYCREVLTDDLAKHATKTLKGRQNILRFLLCASGTSVILDSFCWDGSFEGRSFWSKKNTQLDRAFISIPLKYKYIIKK